MEEELEQLKIARSHLKRCTRYAIKNYPQIYEELIEYSLQESLDEIQDRIEGLQREIRQATSIE